MDWQKSILQKDITYYFKYGEFSGIFTINDHISVYIYIYIYIYMYIHIHIYSYNIFQLVLLDHCKLVETAYSIVNMIQVINKEARAT